MKVTAITVLPVGKPLYSEFATTITIVDEGAGEFVEVQQDGRDGSGKIAISPDEWPTIRRTIDKMVRLCEDEAT